VKRPERERVAALVSLGLAAPGWLVPVGFLLAVSLADIYWRRTRPPSAVLAAGLGLQVEDPASVIPAEVLKLARDGKQVEAIRMLRKAGCGLVAAKRIVDAAG
jgi:hypothetical protein